MLGLKRNGLSQNVNRINLMIIFFILLWLYLTTDTEIWGQQNHRWCGIAWLYWWTMIESNIVDIQDLIMR